jgi:hypothetical protein
VNETDMMHMLPRRLIQQVLALLWAIEDDLGAHTDHREMANQLADDICEYLEGDNDNGRKS